MNRARALAVISRSSWPHSDLASEIRHLINDWGIGEVLTDDALHALALRMIRNNRQRNVSAAASRAHYAAQQEKAKHG